MIEHQCKQGSHEWEMLRFGIPTCSRFHHIFQPVRRERSQRWELYLLELLDEWLTGKREEPFESEWIRRGRALEPEARFGYSMETGESVRQIGFVTRDDGLVGGSPDGLVGADTVLEIKVHSPQVHSALNKSPSHHVGQCQGLLYICEREIAHLWRYSPEGESALQIIERDQGYIDALVPVLDSFIEQLEEAKREVAHAVGVGL